MRILLGNLHTFTLKSFTPEPQGCARGMARMASILSSKGTDPVTGKTIISKDTWEKMHAEPEPLLDAMLGKHLQVYIEHTRDPPGECSSDNNFFSTDAKIKGKRSILCTESP